MASQQMETGLSAKAATELAQSICGIDNRVEVDPPNLPPFNSLCYLSITAHDGTEHIGNGFKIHLKDFNYTAVITCGQCTYIKGKLAKHILVTFPTQSPAIVHTKDLYASPEYIDKRDPGYDYGLILLPGTSEEGFSWSAIFSDAELTNRTMNNCKYPVDHPAGTLMEINGRVDMCTEYNIYYGINGGHSGSPVYTRYNGHWTVVGIQSRGGCPNLAVRLIPEMILRFYKRMNYLKQVTIRSFAFSNVYMRCDGSGVVQQTDNGGGTVNCQYKPAETNEQYYIYPVGMKSSLTPRDSKYPVHILSANWKNVYIRMDGSKMKNPQGQSGGVVNCQFGASIYEIFYLRKEAEGIFSFQSVQFPHCLLRLDGTDVREHTDAGSDVVNCTGSDVVNCTGSDVVNCTGSGVVNCQYRDDPDQPAGALQRFYLESV